MPPVSVLIKPASAACNMNCAYCFYKDEARLRESVCGGMLSLQTAEQIVKKAVAYADGSCSFLFQGGEPTLAGLDFYRAFLALEQKYAKPGLTFYNSIQTNGYALDAQWAEFFHTHHFLVGLSLDGPADIHNANRTDNDGKGTFQKVMHAAQLLTQYKVEYNILCVVTGKNARSIGKIYNFCKKNGFRYLQFIPCLEPLAAKRGEADYALTPTAYARFLTDVFSLWLADLKKGNYISIRHIDNMMTVLLGKPPEMCSVNGHCSLQFVVESDGSVYPCDFYVLDEWRLGSVAENSFAEIAACQTAQKFIQTSMAIPPDCLACRYRGICRNGCRRDRLTTPDGSVEKNYYCAAYQSFFEQNRAKIQEALALLRH